MKNRLKCCFIILFAVLLPFTFQLSALASDTSVNSPFEGKPLYVVFLMDSSGSMKKTDPREIRKLASQVVVTLLSSEDKVAIVEFDSEARVLSDWRPASEKEAVFSAINEIGNNGNFTDFRAALEAARGLFIKAPAASKKVIFLLSDGVFEPNPYSERYGPYSVQYRIAVKGKNKADLSRINEDFRSRLTPVAKRMVDSAILPDLKSKGIEIYTVGFSPDADKDFLDYLADETSTVKTESHYFYANNAVDLMDTFVGLLHFWANKIILRTDNGEIVPGLPKGIALDNFLKDVSFIFLTEKQSDLSVKAEGNYEPEEMLKGLHPDLKIFNVTKKSPPGQWVYDFNNGSGKYKLIVIGQSTLDMVVDGLKGKYAYGEPVRARVSVKYNNRDARAYLSKASKITAEASSDDSKYVSFDLKEDKDGFVMDYLPKAAGKIRLKFTLYGKDKQDNDLLPRPSKEFRLEVLPRFYVEPELIKFGDLGVGKSKERDIKTYSGLPETIHVRMRSVIKNSSRCRDAVERLPYVQGDDFTLSTGQSFNGKVKLLVPAKGCWGDFDGEILFTTDRGENAKIGFRVHVPSIWEKLTCLALALILILAILLIALAIFWGYLKSPVGVLRPVSYPPGAAALSDIKLSRVKRGLWNRWLHWRKNVIKIGASRSDIRLAGLPQKMEVELIFHRFGGDYIRNMSPRESGHILVVQNPDVGIDIERGPGSSYQLSHGLNIKMFGYEFIYENIK